LFFFQVKSFLTLTLNTFTITVGTFYKNLQHKHQSSNGYSRASLTVASLASILKSVNYSSKWKFWSEIKFGISASLASLPRLPSLESVISVVSVASVASLESLTRWQIWQFGNLASLASVALLASMARVD